MEMKKDKKKKNRERVVVRRMSSVVLGCVLKPQPICLHQKYSNISGKVGLWTCCSCCGVSSDSDLALLQLVLFSKVHNYPQSPQSQANCGDLTNVPMTSGANSLPLLWSHSLCSASI